MSDICGSLITESGLHITTEDGMAFLVTECVATIFHPGKVWKRPYPHWQTPVIPEFDEEEELIIMSAIDDL